MHSLREMQIRCRQAFIMGDADALSGLLRAHAGAPCAGISVYQNNARETFRQALLSSYPIIADLVGDKCFAGLSAKYLEAHPSQEPDLQTFSEQFPDFLDHCYARSTYRYLTDVARLELAAEQVLLERETVPLDAQVLASVPQSVMPGISLIPSPAARLVTSDFPILDIWRMHYHDGSAQISLDSGPCHVLAIRDAGDSVLRMLSPLEFQLANRLIVGQPVCDAFESLIDSRNAAELQMALVRLLRYRLFTDIKHC